MNIAFTKDNFEDMANYLGSEFHPENLINAPYLPSIYLSEREKEKIFYAFTELSNYKNDAVAKIK